MTFDDFRKTGKYDIACFSGIGKREVQQDNAYIAADDSNVLIVVCDGMGGFEGGQLASSTAVEAFTEYYQYYCNESGRDMGWMREAADRIDSIVYDLKDEDGKRLGAGTTLIGLNLIGNVLHWISIGDSRVYVFRQKEMVQLTTDHNYFYDLEQRRAEGKISEEKYKSELESGEALISFIGMGGLIMMDVNEEPLQLMHGDSILVCTDGVYRTVSDDELRQIVSECSTAGEAVDVIKKVIEKRNIPSQDNFTYVLLKI